MVKIEVTKELTKEMIKTFGIKKAFSLIDFFETLENNPKKGKLLSNVGNIVIKELKYESFRFYFIADGFKLKFLKSEELKDLVLKFIRMSKKNTQQKTIEEIKILLKKLGYGAF